MPAYDAGMISQEAFLKWIKMVKKREIQNYESLQKRLNLPLLKIPSSLAAAEKYIVQSVHKGTKVRFSTVLDMLKKEGQGWRKTLSENTPQNWAQLRLLSYVVLFMNHVEDSAHRNIMTVAVDDLCEKVIANQYARLKKQLQKNGHVTHPALGLYLSQNIFRTCPNEDSALYRPQKYDLPEVFQLIQSEYPSVTVSAYEEKTFFCMDQHGKSGILTKKR
jgi:hypothetical protein